MVLLFGDWFGVCEINMIISKCVCNTFYCGFQELELLPVKELQSNIYIKHPVSMEQYLMEGSYNKVCLKYKLYR